MIIDTHCHYNLPILLESDGMIWQDHWQKAQEAGVSGSILIGVDLETSQKALELSWQETHFFAAVGYHPHAVDELLLNEAAPSQTILEWMKELSALLDEKVSREKIVAVGETGLDYFRLSPDPQTAQREKSLQQELFTAQIKLAEKYSIPLIIHVRDTGEDAYFDTLSLIKAHKKSTLPFVLHCVSGPLKYVAEAITLGAYIGVAGNCTYKNADRIREIVAFTPKERILLETDAPYLPPMPHRGQICEPWMIQLTANYLQENLDCSLEQIVSNTYQVFPKLKNHD